MNPYEGRDLDELSDDIDVGLVGIRSKLEELLSDDDLAALNEYK